MALRVALLTIGTVGLLTGCAEQAAWQPPPTGGGVSEPMAPAATALAEKRPPGALPAEPSLSDYLAYAALHNPGLAASFNAWKAALEKVPQVKALPDPRFTYRYYIEEVETRVGAQRNSLELSQTFPWFGKLELRGSAAAEAAQAERQRFEAQKRKLFYRVKDAYYEHYYLWRAITTVKENRDLVKHFESVARTRYKAAVASHPDVIRAQVELGKLEDRLRTLQDLREPIVSRLNAALNRPTKAPLPWPAKIEEQEVIISDEQLLAWLAEFNPELKAMESEIARSRHQIELARKEYFPDVTVGVGWIDTAHSIGGRHPDDDGKDPLIAGVSVNVPIWWDRIAAGVREARRRYFQAVHRHEDKANALGAELKVVLYRFQDAERKIDLYRDTLVPKAKESIKATETSFRAGRGTFLDLVDAQRILLEFQLAYERALASRMQRLAELEMLVGKEISGAGSRKAPTAAEQDNSDIIP